jgi:hypothetical protein
MRLLEHKRKKALESTLGITEQSCIPCIDNNVGTSISLSQMDLWSSVNFITVTSITITQMQLTP